MLPVALRLREGRSLTASDGLRINLAARLKGLPQVDRPNTPGFLVTNLAALRFHISKSKPAKESVDDPSLGYFFDRDGP